MGRRVRLAVAARKPEAGHKEQGHNRAEERLRAERRDNPAEEQDKLQERLRHPASEQEQLLLARLLPQGPQRVWLQWQVPQALRQMLPQARLPHDHPFLVCLCQTLPKSHRLPPELRCPGFAASPLRQSSA